MRKLAVCIVDLGVQPSHKKVWLQGKLEFPLAKVLRCIFADKLLLFLFFFFFRGCYPSFQCAFVQKAGADMPVAPKPLCCCSGALELSQAVTSISAVLLVLPVARLTVS